MIKEIMENNSMTKYRLSKMSGVPYTTINDICSGKADLRKCSVDTVYKLSKALKVSMEDLLAPYYTNRTDFELFKSNVCHQLKEMGDNDFLIDLLESRIIIEYYEKKWYPEALYLLAMLDYVSRENNVPICNEYDELRKCKLAKPIYPASVVAMCTVSKSAKAKEEAVQKAIPEFLNYNIVESEVRNVT